MTKQQLLDRSREIGAEITKLINEYRNSMGQFSDHDENYFEDYFAGLIAWLCTGDGEAKLEYSPAKKESDSPFIDGSVTINSEVRYLFSDVHIHDFQTTSETTNYREGHVDKQFSMNMDPITYLYFIMGTDYGGKRIFDGAGVNEISI
jgi:hypothetical protein